MDTLNITKDDVGKLFKGRWGAVIKVIDVNPNSTDLPVTAVKTANGVASNYQLNGKFLLGETAGFDLVERYEPMSW